MTPRHMQSFFTSAGKESCYASCIIMAAANFNGVHGLTLRDIGQALDEGLDGGFIRYNREDDYDGEQNFFVTDPAGFLGKLTGARWECLQMPPNYRAREGELEIDFKVLTDGNAKKGIGHFVLPDWDPIQNSNTGRNGYVYSKRIFRRR